MASLAAVAGFVILVYVAFFSPALAVPTPRSLSYPDALQAMHTHELWTGARFQNATDEQVAEALYYLLRFAPMHDWNLTVKYILDNLYYAFVARESFPWGLSVPWDVFLNDVLPYAALHEPRTPWRSVLFQHYNSIAALHRNGTTLAEAAMAMNTLAWEIVDPPIVFKAAPPNQITTYSVFDVMAAHHSSCTGLSVFFTAALRSVGIPARVAGTPHWNLDRKACPHGDADEACGNHNWVEAWSGGAWAFIDNVYNSSFHTVNASWFFPQPAHRQEPSTLNHSINAASWAPSDYLLNSYGRKYDPFATARPYYPMVFAWNDTTVSAWDVTKRYLPLN